MDIFDKEEGCIPAFKETWIDIVSNRFFKVNLSGYRVLLGTIMLVVLKSICTIMFLLI